MAISARDLAAALNGAGLGAVITSGKIKSALEKSGNFSLLQRRERSIFSVMRRGFLTIWPLAPLPRLRNIAFARWRMQRDSRSVTSAASLPPEAFQFPALGILSPIAPGVDLKFARGMAARRACPILRLLNIGSWRWRLSFWSRSATTGGSRSNRNIKPLLSRWFAARWSNSERS